MASSRSGKGCTDGPRFFSNRRLVTKAHYAQGRATSATCQQYRKRFRPTTGTTPTATVASLHTPPVLVHRQFFQALPYFFFFKAITKDRTPIGVDLGRL